MILHRQNEAMQFRDTYLGGKTDRILKKELLQKLAQVGREKVLIRQGSIQDTRKLCFFIRCVVPLDDIPDSPVSGSLRKSRTLSCGLVGFLPDRSSSHMLTLYRVIPALCPSHGVSLSQPSNPIFLYYFFFSLSFFTLQLTNRPCFLISVWTLV